MIIEEIEDNERDSIVFNRALMEATDNLEPEIYKRVMQMIFKYAFEGEVNLNDFYEKTFFILAKPIIDYDNKE